MSVLRDLTRLKHQRLLGVVGLAFAMTLIAFFVPSAWSDDSAVNFPVNTAVGDPITSTSAPVPDGMIVLTVDTRNGADGDIYAQHMTLCGPADPLWPANGLLVAGGPAQQRQGVVVGDGYGGAYIVWTQGAGTAADVYAQHVLSTGTLDASWPATGLPVCTAGGNQSISNMTTDGNHGVFVTWNDQGRGRAFVQHLIPSGVDPVWAVNGIRVAPGVEITQRDVEICQDEAGGAFLAWVSGTGTEQDIYAQHINAAGAILWSPSGQPVTTAPNLQILNGTAPPSPPQSFFIITYTDVQSNAMVADGAGGCLITWVDQRQTATSGYDIYAQRLDASGSPASGWDPNGVAICTAAGNQSLAFLLADGSGGLFATWADERPGLHVQHATGGGVIDGPVDGLALTNDLDPFDVLSGVTAGAGGAIFTWADFSNPGNADIRAMRVTASPFGPDPSWPSPGAAVSTASEDQFGPVPVSDGSGGAIAQWFDARNYGATGFDIYSQRVLADGTLPSSPVASITGPASGSIYAVNTPITFTGTFTDDGGTHTATWSFDGSAPVVGTVNEGAHTVSVNQTFTTPGVYSVSLTVTDECGNSSTTTTVGEFDALVVIYDPNGGFVTGGGWINSPSGAYVADPTMTGKANFGLVSKYQKNATIPTGDTEFQFKTAGLNFKSTAYEWLVVAGYKAQYKGTGTINGTGSYKFMLTAIDGAFQSNGPDKFRIKITEMGGGLVYDNQLNAPDDDDPTTVLGGGSIVIHKNGNGPAGRDQTLGPLVYALAPGLTNPLRSGTAISYSLAERSRVHIDLYDVSGRKRGALVDDEEPAGMYSAPLSLPGQLAGGVYYLRMVADPIDGSTQFHDTRSIVVTH